MGCTSTFLENYASLVLNTGFIDFRKTFGLSSDRSHGVDSISQESEANFLKRVREYQELVSKKAGKKFPEKPEQHLLSTLLYFSKMLEQPLKLSTSDEISIHVQCLKSNTARSVRGVAYTRNPFTGNADLYGVYE